MPHRAILAGAALTLGLSLVGCGSGGSNHPTASTLDTPGLASGTLTAAPPAATGLAKAAAAGARALWPVGTGVSGAIVVSDTSLVAQARVGSIGIYRSAVAPSPERSLTSPLPSGAPLVFLVQEQRSGRFRVLLPIRPNESQGWIRAGDVKLFQLDYRIVVSVGRHTLTVYRAGRVLMQVPVGLGTSATPTPGGVFYIKELLRPPDPTGAYGPYAFGLSGYSNVLNNFLGGDGEIGIHGTNDPAGIGKSVSHGCIRMSNDNITKLAQMLPLGVPVQIVR